jgi:hypothetical protein
MDLSDSLAEEPEVQHPMSAETAPNERAGARGPHARRNMGIRIADGFVTVVRIATGFVLSF